MDNPHIELILKIARQFRQGSLSADGLRRNISAVVSLIEGDVPKVVRNEIYRTEALIDDVLARNPANLTRKIEEVLDALEETIKKNLPR